MEFGGLKKWMQRGSFGCSVAQLWVQRGSVVGAAWLSCGCSVAQLWVQRGSVGCSMDKLVVRWLAVRQARVRISARHPAMEVPPTQPTAVMIWRWASANVYE